MRWTVTAEGIAIRKSGANSALLADGQQISERMKSEGWGSKVIDRLAVDLRRSFPEMKGLSPRNLRYMRTFAETYQDEQFLQQAAAKLPWGHNVRILDYVRDPDEREFYVRKTIEHGWSRNVLVHQIESDLYHRQGKAIANFGRTLPAPPLARGSIGLPRPRVRAHVRARVLAWRRAMRSRTTRTTGGGATSATGKR
jgi:predicted nuclease of restriction endonuclease-like (RecB) superfamily